jgi:hypothetical protein
MQVPSFIIKPLFRPLFFQLATVIPRARWRRCATRATGSAFARRASAGLAVTAASRAGSIILLARPASVLRSARDRPSAIK